MSKILQAHVQSIDATIASLEEEQNRLAVELSILKKAKALFGVPSGQNSKSTIQLGRTQEIAYKLLQRNTKVTAPDVAKLANVSASAAGQALYKLAQKKLARKIRRGVFVLAK